MDTAHGEVVVHDRFIPGIEADGEASAGDIRAKGNVDDTAIYGLGSGLGNTGESGYDHAGVND